MRHPMRTGLAPLANDASTAFFKQIDKHLFELIGIGIEHDRRTGIKADRNTLLEKRNSLEQRAGLHRLEMRWRQLGKNPVRLHEAMQRVRPALNDTETATEIANRGLIPANAFGTRQQDFRQST